MGDGALNLAQVLCDERAALEGKPLWSALLADKTQDPEVQIGERKKKFKDLDKGDLNDIYRELNHDNRWALCLSGGGLRSAAFALGIVQCFAARTVVAKRGVPTPEPLLTQFDYLSTVSGGGYLGSWLSAWLYQARHTKDGAYTVLKGLADRVGDHDEAEVDHQSASRQPLPGPEFFSAFARCLGRRRDRRSQFDVELAASDPAFDLSCRRHEGVCLWLSRSRRCGPTPKSRIIGSLSLLALQARSSSSFRYRLLQPIDRRGRSLTFARNCSCCATLAYSRSVPASLSLSWPHGRETMDVRQRRRGKCRGTERQRIVGKPSSTWYLGSALSCGPASAAGRCGLCRARRSR